MSEKGCKLIGRLHGGKWDKIYDIGRRVYSIEGYAPTLHTCSGGNIEPKILVPNYKLNNQAIRKLTEQECFRLMGVRDEDYERIAKNQSKSSLYHLAGDSIVTNVLSAIFAEMI